LALGNLLELGYHARILKGHVDKVNALVWIQQIVRQSRQDSAVQAAREQDGNTRSARSIRVAAWGRRRDVEDPQAQRINQLLPQCRHRRRRMCQDGGGRGEGFVEEPDARDLGE